MIDQRAVAAPGVGAAERPGNHADGVGALLGDRYLLETLLGSGAVADVYEARDRQLERQVAVKLLRPEWMGDPSTVASFRREAELAAGLHHPHLAQVYDAASEAGQPYIVMERVPGAPLDSASPHDVRESVHIAAQIAGALAFIHDHGLLHCDVKPANVLVDAQGQAKLVDFGVAAPVGEPAPLPGPAGPAQVTQRLPLLQVSPGLLPYLAPERLAGGPPTSAADVYGLGAVLYTLLSGRPPYLGDTPAAIAAAQQAGPPPPLRQQNPAVPPMLEALASRAIAIDPERRFGSAGELEAALTAVRDQSREVTAAFAGASAPALEPPAGAPAGYRPAPAIPLSAGPDAGRAVMPRWALPVIAGILLLGLLALVVSQLGGPDTRAGAAGRGGTPLPQPAGRTAAPAAALAPQLLGLTLDQARATVQPGGWTLGEAPGVYNRAVTAGRIVAQQPDAGTPVAANAPITVTTSLGPAPAPPTDAPTQAPAPNAGAPAPPAPAPRAGAPPAPAPAPSHGHGGGKDKGKGKGKH